MLKAIHSRPIVFAMLTALLGTSLNPDLGFSNRDFSEDSALSPLLNASIAQAENIKKKNNTKNKKQ